MEFFQTFWAWLDAALQLYIGDNMQRVGMALAPAMISLGTTYVLAWGLLHMTGRIDEPFTTGLKRIAMLAVVFTLSWQFLFYNELIVDTFYRAPSQLAAAVVGAGDPVQIVDAIWSDGSRVAENLQSRVSWSPPSWDFFVMAYVIRLAIGLLCVYTVFLIALSKVALAVLLALGPLFIVMLLFEETRHFFRSWIAQLANYAMVTILAVMVCALMLGVVRKYAANILGLGFAMRTVDALDMILVCALAFLFMMQVTHIAAAVCGGGVALNTLGYGRWAYGKTRQAALLTGVLGWRTGRFLLGMGPSRADTPVPRIVSGGRLIHRNSIEAQV